MGTTLESINGEDAGINEAALDDFIRELEKSPAVLRGFVLAKKDKVAARRFWAPYRGDDPVWVYSLSKSFCSTAVGFAVAEGLFKTNDLVRSFFPEYEHLVTDENCRAMTVQDLLTMRSGHETDTTLPMIQASDWAETFFTLPVKYKPGTHFVYNSGATYMLSAIVQKRAGMTVHEYLKPRLFSPLGFGGTAWDSSPQGINTGGWGLLVSVEDIAKLGLLYLNKGAWQGRQLLPQSWVEEASTPHADNSITPSASSDWVRGYGYQFWRSRYGFRGDGAFGQYCLILPECDAVLALSCETADMQGILDIVWGKLIPALTTATEKTAEKAADGAEYRAEKNSAGIGSIRFNFERDRLSIRFSGVGGESKLTAGRYGWLESETKLPFGAFSFVPVAARAEEPLKVSASFSWKEKARLEIPVIYRNGPHRELLTIYFEGNRVSIKAEPNPASQALGRPALDITAVR
jgi:CubicO group peptidase (beta-lactamase class C family)